MTLKMSKENLSHEENGRINNEVCSRAEVTDIQACHSLDKEAGSTCRVCQCTESDKRGDIALGFLGIIPQAHEARRSNEETKDVSKDLVKDARDSGFVEFISPQGEVFICRTDLEIGLYQHHDKLVELGCACKSDLALVHYACALKWFINHGSTVCEICGLVAKNIKNADIKKVVVSLKNYETLRERTASGQLYPVQVVHTRPGVDPDAVAAIQRQRLSEIALWFNPHTNNLSNNIPSVVSEVFSEQHSSPPVAEDVVPAENPATKWAVEGTGILLATGLLTVTLAWLIAPCVSKKTARSGLHILLGGVCALTIVIFFRFFVLTRIKYGPARYWAILFVFWFLVFGVWASRTHGAHTT